MTKRICSFSLLSFLLCQLPCHGQGTGAKKGHQWYISANYAEYVTEPVRILEKNGPAGTFVAKWRRGRGLDFTIGPYYSGIGRVFLIGVWDRLPLGYATDVEPEKYPSLGLPYAIQDRNLTTWNRRISIGLGYNADVKVTDHSLIGFSFSVLRNLAPRDFSYHSGTGVQLDTSSVWIMGLDARVFPGSSPWQVRAGVRYAFKVYRRHTLSLSITQIIRLVIPTLMEAQYC